MNWQEVKTGIVKDPFRESGYRGVQGNEVGSVEDMFRQAIFQWVVWQKAEECDVQGRDIEGRFWTGHGEESSAQRRVWLEAEKVITIVQTEGAYDRVTAVGTLGRSFMISLMNWRQGHQSS